MAATPEPSAEPDAIHDPADHAIPPDYPVDLPEGYPPEDAIGDPGPGGPVADGGWDGNGAANGNGNGNGNAEAGAGKDDPEIGPAIAVMPHNIEAEQQLLGALLNNNDLYFKVSGVVSPESFFDPVHARLFEVAERRIGDGKLVSPVTMRSFFEQDEALKELGGTDYLVRLAGAAISSFAVRDYAQMIHDLSLRRELISLGQDISEQASKVDPESDGPAQIVEAERKLYNIASAGQTERGFVTFLKAATEAVKVADAAYRRGGGIAGLPTGLSDLDSKLGGLHNSDLIILAGRPSMGKTALATNIAFNVAKRYRPAKEPGEDGAGGHSQEGGVVGFFSLEMSSEQLASRVLAETAEVSSHQIRQGDLTMDEFRRFTDAAKELESCPLYIDDTPALSVVQIASRARRMKRLHGLDLLVVDYLQLCRGAGRSEGRVNEIAEISMGLKAIAKELDIPVLALSQLSRQVESRDDKRPQLADLRESGSIEQDSDVVMFVFRQEYYLEREEPAEHADMDAKEKWEDAMEQVRGRAEVIIGKQRHGPIATVKLAFTPEYTRFSDLARPWEEERAGFE